MTHRSEPTPSRGLEVWAAERLDVPAVASAQTVRRQLLHTVAAEDFLPGVERVYAYQLLHATGTADTPGPSLDAWPAAARADLHAWARTQVEAFAESFFDVPTPERQRRWEELAATCAWSAPLTARLEALRPGLGIGPLAPPYDLPTLRQLSDEIRELFVLRPAERAIKKEALLATKQPRSVWEEVARIVQAQYPRLANLVPEFTGPLTDARWWGRQFAQPGGTSLSINSLGLKAPVQTAPPVQSSGQLSPANIVWIVFVLLSAFFRAISSNQSEHDSPPTRPPAVPTKYVPIPPRADFEPLYPPLAPRAAPTPKVDPQIRILNQLSATATNGEILIGLQRANQIDRDERRLIEQEMQPDKGGVTDLFERLERRRDLDPRLLPLLRQHLISVTGPTADQPPNSRKPAPPAPTRPKDSPR